MKAAIECPRGMWIESTAAKTPDGMEITAALLRRAHRENQDVVLVSDSGECAMVVDGMGGRAHGALYAAASARMGLDALEEGLSARAALDLASQAAGNLERHVVHRHGGAAGVSLRVRGNHVEWASKGDVAVFGLCDGKAKLLSQLDSADGKLTNYLGCPKRSASGSADLPPNAALLVATDGCWRYANVNALARAARGEQAADLAERALARAVEGLTPDDASALALRRSA